MGKETLIVKSLYAGKAKVKELILKKATFTVSETSKTMKIDILTGIGKHTIIYSTVERNNKYLSIIAKLKSEISERSDTVVNSNIDYDKLDNNFYEYSLTINQSNVDEGIEYHFGACREVDITHAYYRAAFVLGFISESLYKDIINNVSKQDRLSILGSIASVKVVTKYVNGDEVFCDVQFSKLHRMAWRKICCYIDLVMVEMKYALKDHFIFYWVDGIYFKEPEINEGVLGCMHKIRQICLKYNVEFKSEPIESMYIKSEEKQLNLIILREGKKPKIFCIDKARLKYYKISNFKI